jgi:hypothetical protein
MATATVIPAAPPPGWERETPKYRAIRDLHPAAKARFRSEPPFAHCWDSSEWQYAIGDVKAGDVVETREWPHASFAPLNYAAKKVLEFFTSQQKSRLPRSPWFGDRIRLDSGLNGPQPRPMAIKAQPVHLSA